MGVEEAPAVPRRSDGGGGRPLSEVLAEIAADDARQRVSIADLLAALRDRALAALLLLFALPNVVPAPPGTSAILGAPLLFLAAQLTLGMRPWLPRLIADRSMSRAHFAAFVERGAPWLKRAERLLRPRWTPLTRRPIEYVVGALCLVLALIVFLPIPLGNMLPSLAICLFALGILERDGVWVLAGLAASIVAIAFVWGVLYALVKSVLFLLANAFA